MRRKPCAFCSGKRAKLHDRRKRKVRTSSGKRIRTYRRWLCKDCNKSFTPTKIKPVNFSLQIKACELYYDSEASYRAIGRQLGMKAYHIFQIINALGANCKSTVEVAKELKPRWSGY
ncbi:MAG: hypothetical protein JSV84_09620, partial [Gemmatimonadota bacterium]